MAETKRKGDLAELRVACDLLKKGHRVAIPFGEDSDYDLVLDRDRTLERVQVKYVQSDGIVIHLRCRSHSLTNGKVRAVKHYTAETIDWLAVYDLTTDACFYIPASLLGTGRSMMSLRLQPTRNGQSAKVNMASDFSTLNKGLEVRGRRMHENENDGASGIRTHDLPDANRTL